MKIDGSARTREMLGAVRFMALRQIADGESLEAIIASFGIHRWAYDMRLRARESGKGKRAVRLRKAPGQLGKLTTAQERHLFRWIHEEVRRRYGFDFALWTLPIARELAEQRVRVALSLASVNALLALVVRNPQKPLQRARQPDPAASVRWRREVYRGMPHRPKRSRSDIYFRGESELPDDPLRGNTPDVKGDTPVVLVP